MTTPTIWEGVCNIENAYRTSVKLEGGKVWIRQEAASTSYDDVVVMETSEAIDIAFAILRDLAPTIHETLMQLNIDSSAKV